jgi:hypothetical protein
MFSLPAPSVSLATEEDKYDEAPLVWLHDDAMSLKAFLSVIYNPFDNEYECCHFDHDNYQLIITLASILPIAPLSPDFTTTIKPVLQLATKYQENSLRDRIVAVLEREWPSALDEWDNIENYKEGSRQALRRAPYRNHSIKPFLSR